VKWIQDIKVHVTGTMETQAVHKLPRVLKIGKK